MSAFNIVRFRVKPGRESQFLDAHRDGKVAWPGLLRGTMVQTGDHTFCLIGEWNSTTAIAEARARMIETLNSFRDMKTLVAASGSPTRCRVRPCSNSGNHRQPG